MLENYVWLGACVHTIGRRADAPFWSLSSALAIMAEGHIVFLGMSTFWFGAVSEEDD